MRITLLYPFFRLFILYAVYTYDVKCVVVEINFINKISLIDWNETYDVCECTVFGRTMDATVSS